MYSMEEKDKSHETAAPKAVKNKYAFYSDDDEEEDDNEGAGS